MAKKSKKYLVTKNSEAYACSLVTSPAVEETFVAFNEETPIIEKFADEKKHMITGVVAIPQKPIYRRNADGEEYDIVFSEEAIESMAKDFMKNYRQHEVTLQHEENADGVYLVEQWIKSDMVYDKSIAMGLSRELPVGSWIQTYYVDSNDVWQRIENGELLGFSLECMLGLEEFEAQLDNKNNEDMIETNEMFWDKLKNILSDVFTSLSMVKKEEVEMEEETPKAEEPATVEPTEPIVEEPTETPKVEEPTPVEEPTETPKVDDHNAQLEELIKSMKEEIEALKGFNNDLQDKVKEMSKEPSAKPINTQAKPSTGNTYSDWRRTMADLIGRGH